MPAAPEGISRSRRSRSDDLRRVARLSAQELRFMRVELTKDYRFEAAHRLPQVPPDHKCSRMHGHSFCVEITIAGEVDQAMGWLQDFGDITAIVEPMLKRELDHRTLNDIPGLENPTSEVLCGWL